MDLLRRPPKTSSSQQVLILALEKINRILEPDVKPSQHINQRLCQEMLHTPQINCNQEKSCEPPFSSCCRFKTVFAHCETELQNNLCLTHIGNLEFCPEEGQEMYYKNTNQYFSTLYVVEILFLRSALSTFEVAPG